MDKSVYNMKAEKIQKQVKQGDYETAVKICDGIDWTQVKSTRMLSLVSSIYEHVQKYDTAIDILLMAYEEAPVGRRFLYKLTELALAAGNIKEAEEYYKNYLQEAAEDNSRYILRYLIAEAKHETLDKRITILEAYKKKEFDERWSCRLAELCDEIGNADRCVAICDEIILWFGVGPYVEKAFKLKEKYVPLTPEQEEKRQSLFMDRREAEEVVASESGQSVSTLDTAVIEEEQGQLEPEDEKYNTRKISDKDDFNHTRIFEKLPMDEAEMQLFKTIPAASEETAPVEAAAPAAPETEEDDPNDGYQMEFDWNAEAPSKIVFLGADTPSLAMEMAASKLSEVHQKFGETMGKAVKITGAKLNEKGLLASLPLLEGKDLIVLGASALTNKSLNEIEETIDSTGKVIILADSKERIDEVEARYYGDRPVETEVSEEPEVPVEPEVPAETETPVEEETEAPEEPEAPVEEEAEVPEEEETEAPEEPEAPAEEEAEVPEEEEDPAEAEPETPVEEEAEVPVEEEDPVEAEPETSVEEAEVPVEEEEPVEAEPEASVEEEPEFEPDIDEIENELPIIQLTSETEEPEAPAEEPEEKPAPVIIPPAGPVNPPQKGLSPEEFYKEVCDYMNRIDCVLEDGKDTALLDYFYRLSDEGEELSAKMAAEMVEEAADAAESHSFSNVFHSRYDDDGNLVLKLKHFI